MVKNYDYVCKNYPELVSKALSYTDHIAYNIRTNKVEKCTDTPCRDCMFSNENNNGEYDEYDDCNDRIKNG